MPAKEQPEQVNPETHRHTQLLAGTGPVLLDHPPQTLADLVHQPPPVDTVTKIKSMLPLREEYFI